MKKKNVLKTISLFAAAVMLTAGLSSCRGGGDQVVFYTNADDEAVTAMKNALDNNGYSGQYICRHSVHRSLAAD